MAAPARLVEVWASARGVGRCGSGWVIGNRGVMTARHVIETVFAKEEPTCQVRLATSTSLDDWIDMTVVREHAHLDLALLDARSPDDPASGPETFASAVAAVPLRVARIGDGVVAAEAVGFPDSSTRPDGMRRPEQPSGVLMPAGGARDEHGRVPFDVSTTVPESSPLWEGMSGGAVRDGHGRLIGLVVSVHPNRQQRRLFVIPVEDVLTDPEFARRAYSLGWPRLYEDPDTAQAAIDVRKQRVTLLRWLGEFPEQVEMHSRALWRLGFGQSGPMKRGTEAAAELRSLEDEGALSLVRRCSRIEERLPELFASTNPSEWSQGAFAEVFPAFQRETGAWFSAMRHVRDSLAGELKFPVEGGGSLTVSTSMLFSSLDVLEHERTIKLACGSLIDLFPIDEAYEADQ